MNDIQSRKTIHKEKVIRVALDFFSTFGIENSKVSDIATKANLTERTVFRYFATKNDLVLATTLLFWNSTSSRINKLMEEEQNKSLKGIDKVRFILNQYASLYDSSKKELIFCDEAETYLSRCGKSILLSNRPPIDFYKSNEPLAKAIKDGILDKSIKDNKDIGLIYLNTYDGLFGFMQKLALSEELSNEKDARRRLDLFIDCLIKMYI